MPIGADQGASAFVSIKKLLESHEINVIAYNLNSKEAGKTSFQK
ncbi:hypothetical protein [Cytobacillus firmus]